MLNKGCVRVFQNGEVSLCISIVPIIVPFILSIIDLDFYCITYLQCNAANNVLVSVKSFARPCRYILIAACSCGGFWAVYTDHDQLQFLIAVSS